MKNCEFWGDAETARKMYDKWRSLVKEEDRRGTDDICKWLYKAADTALEFEVGEILQYKVNTETIKYIKVTSVYGDPLYNIDRVGYCCDATGSGYMSRPAKHIYPASTKIGDMPSDEFKRPDIPKDFMVLLAPQCPVLDKCPLKKPRCIEEDAEQGDLDV